ncbi:MAG: hypothetical protein N3A38_05375 [Planctomycetota bacterium]|nr:hypothetical protein [Planctomycetota bacterium]
MLLLAGLSGRDGGSAGEGGIIWRDPAGAWEISLSSGWIAGTKDYVLAAVERSSAAPPAILDAFRKTSVPSFALLPAVPGGGEKAAGGDGKDGDMDAGGDAGSGPAPRMPAIAAVIGDGRKSGEIEVTAHSVAAAKTAAMGVLAEWLMPGCAARIETVRPVSIGGRGMFEMRGTLDVGGASLNAAFYAAPSGGRMYYLIVAFPEEAARGGDADEAKPGGAARSGAAETGSAAGSTMDGGPASSLATDPATIAAAWKLARPAKTASFVYTRTGKRLIWGLIGASVLAAFAALAASAARKKQPSEPHPAR